MTDEEHAKRIANAIDELNSAVLGAAKAGLDVKIDRLQRNQLPLPETPFLVGTVNKPIARF